MKRTSRSADETFALAQEYARSLRPGDVLALIGELGAGKTRFVQGLARGLDVPPEVFVRSPSFALINEYRGGALPLYHVDFYRLDDASALDDLGLEEYFDGRGVTAVEWADHFPGAMPRRTRRIAFRVIDETTREIEFMNHERGAHHGI